MKALFYRYGSICEPDILETLGRLGIQVDEVTNEITNKSITPTESIEAARKYLDGNEKYAFMFTINFFPWLAEVCNIYHIFYISLIVDSPVLELYSNSIRLPFNRVFLFDRCLFEEFKSQNPGHIFHVPLATNIARNDRVTSSATSSTRKKFTSDISFIGSLYSEKCAYNNVALPDFERGFCEGLIEAQLKVYGYNFIEECLTDEFVSKYLECAKPHYEFPENSRQAYKSLVAQMHISVKVAEQERIRALTMLSEHFNVDIYTGSDTSMMPKINNRGYAASLTEMPIIFNQSKINLNITAKSIRSGLSLRIFDVLGCGGFLITNYQAELGEFYTIGEDLETYSSLEELNDKCDFYLKNDTLRKKIACHGYETTARLHNYDTRLLEILKLSTS